MRRLASVMLKQETKMMMRVMRLIAFACALLCVHANGAEIYNASDTVHKPTVVLAGEIVPGDYLKLLNVMKDVPLPVAGTRYMFFYLNSPGGNFLEGAKLADAITSMRQDGIDVDMVVASGAQCNSSCLSLFAAGTRRAVGTGGYDSTGTYLGAGVIAVHTASLKGSETEGTLATSVMWARQLQALGTPMQVIGKLITTDGSKGATQLSNDDLIAWPNTHFLPLNPR